MIILSGDACLGQAEINMLTRILGHVNIDDLKRVGLDLEEVRRSVSTTVEKIRKSLAQIPGYEEFANKLKENLESST